MRRAFALLLSLVLLAPNALAAEQQRQLEEFRRLDKPLSMRFVQKLYSDTGEILERQEGRLELLPPNRFRWIYQSPYESEFGSDGLSSWHWEPDLAQIILRDASEVIAGTPLALLLDPEQALPPLEEKDGWLHDRSESKDQQFLALRLQMHQGLPRRLELVDLLDQLSQVELFDWVSDDKSVDPRLPVFGPETTVIDQRAQP